VPVHSKFGLGAKQVPHVFTCLMHPDAQVNGNCFAVQIVDDFLQVLPALQRAACLLMRLCCQHDV
jgi:hypothetical protein